MLRPLSSLLTGDPALDGDRPLALGPDGPLGWGDFRRQVASWRQRLAAVNDGYIAIHQPDANDFLACLWAIWQLRKTAVVSTTGFRNTPHIVPTGGDRGAADNGIASGVDGSIPAIHRQAGTALLLFTSGSSGAPQVVGKTLVQLDAELTMLETLWGESVADSLFANMVSHHHMYGLPFGLLWPLARGTPFFTRTIHYAEPLESLAREHRLTLVTSPVQLQNLPDNLDWPQLQRRTARIFSAGAALPATTAARCLALFVRPVTEIYGSTETGAVAWREQPGDHSWHCLPGVVATSEIGTRQLRISSPTLGGEQWQTMADLAEVHCPNSFDLGARVDRIVKVGGKRISLTAIETALASHPWVAEARLVLLAERKERLGAVVALTAEGNAVLIDRGRLAINKCLLRHIDRCVERIGLPRYWRYVAKMPTNSQAKTTADDLAGLFIDERQSRFATVIELQELAPDHRQLTLHIPHNLYYFAGHFPGNPVLPGVVQTHWAIHHARELFAGVGDFVGLEAVKFQHIIGPGAVVTLDLQWHRERSKLRFSYRSSHAQHSSGRILFVPAHSAGGEVRGR